MGFDIAGMDPQVAPGADFYCYANGCWLASTRIPADTPIYARWPTDELDRKRVAFVVEPEQPDRRRFQSRAPPPSRDVTPARS
ncbi:MAG: hypothetical protein E6J90_02370 [Deltaproteobacteria bacterium]|nr:MAG: hypothetical protein E6J90_02370 [Deltaproteobacteria bacterium]